MTFKLKVLSTSEYVSFHMNVLVKIQIKHHAKTLASRSDTSMAISNEAKLSVAKTW
jgi:hypothetical protein